MGAIILNTLASVEGANVSDLIARKQAVYANAGQALTVEQAMDEIVADFTGQMVEQTDLFTSLAQENPSVAKRVLDTLKATIAKIQAIFEKNRNARDQYAQNEFGVSFDQLKEAAKLWQAALNEAGVVVSEMESTTEGQKNTQGQGAEGGVRYSINKSFPEQLKLWLQNGGKGGGYITVGTTSDALKSIDVKDCTIYWDKTKLSKIMDDHPEMDVDTIAKVPQIMEHPIIVMQSKTVANRIILFGELVVRKEVPAKGGIIEKDIPVVAAMELRPHNKRGEISDFIKVASSYSRDSVQNDIDTSDILYIDEDKNRTNTWLEALGLQLPAGLTEYGPINKVTYVDKDVNGNIVSGYNDNTTEMQRAYEKALRAKTERYSLRDSTESDKAAARGEETTTVGPDVDPFGVASKESRRLQELAEQLRIGTEAYELLSLRKGKTGAVRVAFFTPLTFHSNSVTLAVR